ncbi:MAG TPA: hypothetical protein VFQ63_01520 [Patescibacteria group bacterium]|nr:hypothetical protein [Patescibacteria group bacterium]
MDNLQKLQQQSLQMQQSLQQEEVITDLNGVKIVMRGDQYVREVLVNGQPYPQIAEAINDAIQKTQALAAQKIIALNR